MGINFEIGYWILLLLMIILIGLLIYKWSEARKNLNLLNQLMVSIADQQFKLAKNELAKLSNKEISQKLDMLITNYLALIENSNKQNRELLELLEDKTFKINSEVGKRKELELFLKQILLAIELLPIPIMILDKSGNLYYYNSLPEEFNTNLLENLGKNISLIDIIPFPISDKQNLYNCIKHKESYSTIIKINSENQKSQYQFQLIPFVSTNNQVTETYFLVMLQNITDKVIRETVFRYLEKLANSIEFIRNADTLARMFGGVLREELSIHDFYIFINKREETEYIASHRKTLIEPLQAALMHHKWDILHTGYKFLKIDIKQDELDETLSDYFLTFSLAEREENLMFIAVSGSNVEQLLRWLPDLKILFEQFMLIVTLFNEHQKMLDLLRQYKKLFNEAQDAIIERDMNHIINNVNQAAVTLFQCESKQQLLGREYTTFFTSKADIEFYNSLLQSTEHVKDYETKIQLDDGSTLYVNESCSIIKDVHNNKIGYRSTLRDISPKIAIENMLINKNRELVAINKKLKETQSQMIHQEKLASIGQLAAGIAHEINNPLGFVFGNFGTLKKYSDKIKDMLKELESKIIEFGNDAFITLFNQLKAIYKIDFIFEDLPVLFQDSEEGFNRITQIIENMRTFSRVDSGSNEEYNLNEGIKSTLIIAKNAYKYVAEIVTEFGDIPDIKINGNELNQVFLNIITNAAQAIESQNRENMGKILIKTYLNDQYIVCEIGDDGPGIPEEIRSKIFDPFFTTKEVGKGTGLGLHICYDIVVNKLNGKISVESEVGKGSNFIIKIPVTNKEENLEEQENE